MSGKNKNNVGRPPKYNIPEMIQVVEKYIESQDIPILKEVCYQNRWNYKYIYELAEKNPEFSESIKRLIDKKEAQIERLALRGEVQQTMAIFSLKQLGWKDRHEVEHSGSLEVSSPREELMSKLKKIKSGRERVLNN